MMATDFQTSVICRLSSKSAVNWKLKNASHFKCVTSLSLEIVPIVQGRIATLLRYGGIFNDHFIINFLLSLLVKEF